MALFAAGVIGGVLGVFGGAAGGELVGAFTGVAGVPPIVGPLALPLGAETAVEPCPLALEPPHALKRKVNVATGTAARREVRNIELPVR